MTCAYLPNRIYLENYGDFQGKFMCGYTVGAVGRKNKETTISSFTELSAQTNTPLAALDFIYEKNAKAGLVDLFYINV